MPKSRFVAGEGFSGDVESFMTVQQICQMSNMELQNVELVIGLGLSEVERALLFRLADAVGATVRSEQRSPLADKTHKVRPENILIRAPITAGDVDVYEFTLDEANELLQDHRTGKHVPGIVSLEACRQATINSFEIRHTDRNGLSQIWCGCSKLQLPQYYFALPTLVRVTYEDVKAHPLRRRWNYRTEVEIIQRDLVVACVHFEMSAVDTEKLALAEQRALSEALSYFDSKIGRLVR